MPGRAFLWWQVKRIEVSWAILIITASAVVVICFPIVWYFDRDLQTTLAFVKIIIPFGIVGFFVLVGWTVYVALQQKQGQAAPPSDGQAAPVANDVPIEPGGQAAQASGGQEQTRPPNPHEYPTLVEGWNAVFDWYYTYGKANGWTLERIAKHLRYSPGHVRNEKGRYDAEHKDMTKT